MMTDRELLELAAKAAAQNGSWIEHPHEGWGFWQKPAGGEWNPLTDDADALRLAVKLNIDLVFNRAEDEQTVQAIWPDPTDPYAGATFTEDFTPDKGAATRRAIVCAAAEIGRTMTASSQG